MPADSPSYVLDACAVIALMQREPGAEKVVELLEEGNRCLIHAINACEIYYDVYRRSGEDNASALAEILEKSGVGIVEELASSLWQQAGKLKAEWRRVSLADCIALALTILENGTLVTSDRHELERIAEAGICPILFIR